jgi:hypothetical protein
LILCCERTLERTCVSSCGVRVAVTTTEAGSACPISLSRSDWRVRVVRPTWAAAETARERGERDCPARNNRGRSLSRRRRYLRHDDGQSVRRVFVGRVCGAPARRIVRSSNPAAPEWPSPTGEHPPVFRPIHSGQTPGRPPGHEGNTEQSGEMPTSHRHVIGPRVTGHCSMPSECLSPARPENRSTGPWSGSPATLCRRSPSVELARVSECCDESGHDDPAVPL